MKSISSPKKATRSEDYLVPITLGVAGHRDLRPEDRDGLSRTVAGVLKDLQQRYPSTKLVLFSALAEGADRLVAQVALSLPRPVELIVPLPLPIDEYVKDFETDKSRREFFRLLKQASRYYEVPESSSRYVRGKGKFSANRERKFAVAGAHIARQSQILIALWDGLESTQRGGTSDIVQMKLGVDSHPAHELDGAESGPVYHIVTPRQCNPSPKGEPYSLHKLYSHYWGEEDTADAVFTRIFRMVNVCNKDITSHWRVLSTEIPKRKQELLGSPIDIVLDEPSRVSLDRCALADALADTYKSKRIKAIKGILGLVVVGFFLFQIYLELSRQPLVLLMYPLTIGLGMIWYLYAKRRAIEYKHEDYRALAEGLRVQLFWEILDIGEQVSDHYLRKHKGELEWIRYTMRTWEVLPNPHTSEEPKFARQTLLERCRLSLKGWVNSQQAWFAKRAAEDHAHFEAYEWSANRLFVIGVALAVILFIVEMPPVNGFLDERVLATMHHFLVLFIAMALAVSAALQGLVEKLVLSEQAKQYHRMAEVYAAASRSLNQLLKENDTEGMLDVFLMLGKEALIENGDWLLLHRSRPMDIPRVG